MFKKFLNALLATMWLAGVLLLAEEHAWLDGLDNLMFAHAVDTTDAASPAAQGDTVVVLVSRSLYETAFRERSPLDPRVLDHIVAGIAASHPKQLAIDLDISPSPSDADLSGAEAARDSLLQRLQGMAGAEQGSRVLMVLPGVSVTPAEQTRKAAWAGTVCQAGVELADTSLGLSHTPAGLSLLKYVAEVPSLGILMAEPERAGLCASRNADGSLPTLMLSPNGAAVSVMNVTDSAERSRINFKAFDATRVLSLNTMQDIEQLPQRLAEAKASTVLLAGGYSEADSFTLPNGRQVTGAEVHAAVAFSKAHPVHAQHAMAYFIDLVLGCTVGLALMWLWEAYQETVLLSAKTLYLGAALLVMGLPILGLLYFMPAMLARDWWINAIPLVIGLAIHGVMETLSKPHTAHQRHATQTRWTLHAWWQKQLPGPQQRTETLVQCAWLLLRCGFLVFGLYQLTLAFLHH